MDEKKLTINFKKAKDYRIVFANRIFGGLTPSGEHVQFDLMVDHNQNPEYMKHPVHQNGQVDISRENEERFPEDTQIMREAQIGVILSLNDAKSIADWLYEKVGQATR